MKQVIFNVETGLVTKQEISGADLAELASEPILSESERIAQLESTQGKVIDVIAVSLGVTI